MTREQLAEIRARVEAASPAPWFYVHGYGFSVGTAWHGDGPPNADTDFIAAARTDVPALLDEVERLQRALDAALLSGRAAQLPSDYDRDTPCVLDNKATTRATLNDQRG